ncbi:hypothetical protein AB4Y45_27860 [Paraburkholderia sp. EG287A]|uniref:hypothetical protein n=1 Tax=Paraburkholderia sp. EG287A TaxID=3237012 RepID=UPI0034D31878
MSTRSKLLLGPGLAFCLIVLIGWYSGADYLQRGADPALWVLEATLAALALFFQLNSARPLVTGSRAVRLTCTAIAPLVVLALGWYRGVDLAARGGQQGYLLLCGLGVAWLAWQCPLWKPTQAPRQDRC